MLSGSKMQRCDRHSHELAGERPVIAHGRSECVGKGARRNSPDRSDEGYSGEGEPMRDLKEASDYFSVNLQCKAAFTPYKTLFAFFSPNWSKIDAEGPFHLTYHLSTSLILNNGSWMTIAQL